MKKLFFFAGFFLLAAVGLVSGKDKIASFYLSEKTGLGIRVRDVCMPRIGQVVFSDLVTRDGSGGREWFRAEKGTLVLWAPGDLSGVTRIALENVALGGSLQKKALSFFSWAKKSGKGLPIVERVDLAFWSKGEILGVRVLKAQGYDFKLRGGVQMRARHLEKLSARIVVTDPTGSRSFGLMFGGTTWTLRGAQGPLLQFRGEIL